jgi:hypothetical protein
VTKLRTIIGSVLGVAAVLLGGLAVSVPASASTGHGAMIARDHARRCTNDWTITHNPNLVQMALRQTCGLSYRAYGNWQNTGFRYGTYRKTSPSQGVKYSVACGELSCQSGAGTLFSGGYQRKSDGRLFCTISCSAHATALLAARRSCATGHVSWAVGPQGTQSFTWDIVTLDTADSPAGCEQVLARILTTGGNTYRSGLIRNPGSAKVTAKDGTSVAKAWEEQQPYNDPGGRECRQTFPNVEINLHRCTG